MLVSVIVPVYNVEAYIGKCIDSILSQTFTDFELLLIDDGSSDNSLKICRQYESKDPRVRIFFQKNSGPSKARNLGIVEAKGKYVTFVDSDDYVDSDYLLELTKYDSDLVSSGFKLWYAKDDRTEYKSYDHFFYATKEDHNINLAIEEGEFKYLLAGPCCKLYKKSILLKYNILFDESLTYGEDHLFNLRYLQYTQDLVLIPYAGYVYTHYDKLSLTNRIVPYKEMYRYNELCLEARLTLIFQYNFTDKYVDFINYSYSFYFWQMIASIYISQEKKENRVRFLRCIFKDNTIRNLRFQKNLPIFYNVLFFLYKLCPIMLADFLIYQMIRFKYLKCNHSIFRVTILFSALTCIAT